MVIDELMPHNGHNNDKKQPLLVKVYMFYKPETDPYIDGMSTIVKRPETASYKIRLMVSWLTIRNWHRKYKWVKLVLSYSH